MKNVSRYLVLGVCVLALSPGIVQADELHIVPWVECTSINTNSSPNQLNMVLDGIDYWRQIVDPTTDVATIMTCTRAVTSNGVIDVDETKQFIHNFYAALDSNITQSTPADLLIIPGIKAKKFFYTGEQCGDYPCINVTSNGSWEALEEVLVYMHEEASTYSPSLFDANRIIIDGESFRNSLVNQYKGESNHPNWNTLQGEMSGLYDSANSNGFEIIWYPAYYTEYSSLDDIEQYCIERFGSTSSSLDYYILLYKFFRTFIDAFTDSGGIVTNFSLVPTTHGVRLSHAKDLNGHYDEYPEAVNNEVDCHHICWSYDYQGWESELEDPYDIYYWRSTWSSQRPNDWSARHLPYLMNCGGGANPGVPSNDFFIPYFGLNGFAKGGRDTLRVLVNPELVRAESVISHGTDKPSSDEFRLQVYPVAMDNDSTREPILTCEPRAINSWNHQLMLHLSGPVESVTVTVDEVAVSPANVLIVNGDEVLSNGTTWSGKEQYVVDPEVMIDSKLIVICASLLTDGQIHTIAVSGDATGSFEFRVMNGDIHSQDATVNALDKLIIRPGIGHQVNSKNYLLDINADGEIDEDDQGLIDTIMTE